MFTMTNDVCTLFFFLYMNHVLAICFSVYPHLYLAPPYLNFNLQPRVVSEIIYLLYNYLIYF